LHERVLSAKATIKKTSNPGLILDLIADDLLSKQEADVRNSQIPITPIVLIGCSQFLLYSDIHKTVESKERMMLWKRSHTGQRKLLKGS
jgi:hypothetical protein